MSDTGTPDPTDPTDDDGEGSPDPGDDKLVQIQVNVPPELRDQIAAEAKARAVSRDVLLRAAIPAGLARLIPADEVQLIRD